MAPVRAWLSVTRPMSPSLLHTPRQRVPAHQPTRTTRDDRDTQGPRLDRIRGTRDGGDAYLARQQPFTGSATARFGTANVMAAWRQYVDMQLAVGFRDGVLRANKTLDGAGARLAEP